MSIWSGAVPFAPAVGADAGWCRSLIGACRPLRHPAWVAAALASVLMMAVLAMGAATAQADLYWDHNNPHEETIEINPGPGGSYERPGYENPLILSKANDEGGELNTEFANPVLDFPVNAEEPEGFAAQGDYIYYTVPSGIARLAVTGGSPELEFIRLPNTHENAHEEWEGELTTFGITVSGEYIYWTTAHDIGRAKVDGSEVRPDFITSPGTSSCAELAAGGGYIFWNNGNRIFRAKPNGTEVTEVAAGFGGGLAANDNHLYVGHGDHLDRANLDGKELTEWVTFPSGGYPGSMSASQTSVYFKVYAYDGLKEGIYRFAANGPGGTLGAGNLLVEGEVSASLEHADGSLDALAVTTEEGCQLPASHTALSGFATPNLALPLATPDGGASCSPGPVVNSTGDDEEEASGSRCSTGTEITVETKKVPECTLRAAIEFADHQTPSSSPLSITFNIPGVSANTIAKISPSSSLPDITVPVEIDATTQPGAFTAGTRTIGAIIDGTNAGKAADGLELGDGSAGSVIKGLQIQNFDDIGVIVATDKAQVADSVLTSDGSGVQVEGTEDVIGAGSGLPGDIFFKDGSIQKAVNFVKSNAGRKLTPGEVSLSEIGFGAGILMDRSSSGTVISGDAIGIHGAGFSAAPDQLDPDGFGGKALDEVNANSIPDGSPFAILIAPEKPGEEVSNVTIEKSTLSGSFFGLSAFGTPETPISGLTIKESKIGTETDGEPLAPLGAFLGMTIGGTISGLRVGVPGEGNYFGGALLGAVLAGTELASPRIQGNAFGLPRSLRSFKYGGGLENQNAAGVVLADVQGAEVGGTGTQEGNALNGTGWGTMIVGTKNANDAIVGNRFGSDSYVPLTELEGSNAEEQFYGLIGVANLAGSEKGPAAQNLTVAHNSFQNVEFGTMFIGASGVNVDANIYNGDLSDALIAANNVNIGSPGAGNVFENSPLGLVLVSTELTPAENKDAGVNPKADSAHTRSEYLNEPNENLGLDVVNEDSTAEVTPSSVAPSGQSTGSDSIIANRFGVDGSGNPAPDVLPLLVGEEPSLQFGGTGSGQGNIVEDNKLGGLLIAGAHSGVQVLGNRIYNNQNFSAPIDSGTLEIPGLGINLIEGSEAEGGPAVPFAKIGVDPQDPTQPDAGPNNVQNSPVLTSAVSSGGQLTVTGSLHGVANTNYIIEVFADERQNPYGVGEGETLLGRLSLSTDSAGTVGFTATFASPGSIYLYRYVSSTATTVPASGLGVTSEFSVNVPITATTASGTGTTGTTGTTGATGVSGTSTAGAPTGVTVSAGSTTTSGATVTLPTTATCSSATSTPCTVTVTGTVAAATASASRVLASAARSKSKGHKAPVTVGTATFKLSAGTTAKLKLTLTKAGFALLRKRKSLVVTVTAKISGAGRATVSKTFDVRVLYKPPAKAKKR